MLEGSGRFFIASGEFKTLVDVVVVDETTQVDLSPPSVSQTQ